jgi:endonuclease/exonuclease/phosphatase family metal-dependent hydrolase
MKRVLAAAVFTALGLSGAAAQDTNCGARGPAPRPGEIKLVSWNIQELATAVKVYDRAIRTEDEFKDLRMYRDCAGGDVYAMQEIGSLRALGRVFPPSDYILCISGQTVADQRGLAPDYPRGQLAGITPQCVADASTAVSALPGELTNPARQYVALAVKRSAGIALGETKDIVDIGQKDPVTGHQTRWGLDVTLTKGGSALRLLVVHMKSSCTEEPIDEPSSNDNCPAVFRQLPHLKSWIWNANQTGAPVIVLGDFNRRFDRESPDVKATDFWDVITGASTPSPADDVKLAHIPENKEFKCWPVQPAPQRFPIDFFVLNDKAVALADAASYWKWRYGKDIEEHTPQNQWPSDHCPIQLNVRMP